MQVNYKSNDGQTWKLKVDGNWKCKIKSRADCNYNNVQIYFKIGQI
jgi:hypothetical protein